MSVCPKCGLPPELCVCETIAKEAQKIRIGTEKKRYGKLTTIVQGIDAKDIDIKELAKKLKSELACGGTIKDSIIELQGDHKRKIKDILIRNGFSESQIEVR
ncbi:MAG: stress response translation initiation inhibitor YciH [Candidatus Nanoarchaeia archaeon]|nr:stress response translation initiation inhibitor YciH [Candidatus Nanoarchaeia archaeon]MDD5239664.1 stress response translation initiation inhibitor YciH [Candidatus Nanoarchaeia archaeon]